VDGEKMESAQKPNEEAEFYRDEHFSIDFRLQLATLDDQRLCLRRKEYDLLALLARHSSAIIPRGAADRDLGLWRWNPNAHVGHPYLPGQKEARAVCESVHRNRLWSRLPLSANPSAAISTAYHSPGGGTKSASECRVHRFNSINDIPL
jgi:hypothetical protein